NAFHAMAPRGGELTLRAERECVGSECADAPPPGPYLALRFEDTGSGIPPEDLPHLFQPFFTTQGSGTGLGLFSCQRSAADHGGSLEAANRPEGGACFTLRLPVAEKNGAPEPPASRRSRHRAPRGEERPSPSTRRRAPGTGAQPP